MVSIAPRTLQEAVLYFSDYQNCHDFMIKSRWPDGVVRCPTCGAEKLTYLESARLWKCYSAHPKAKFSLKVGTIFEDSHIGLEKWLPAMWLLSNCKNGISSCELAADLGITQKSAWFMLQRLRLAMWDDGETKLTGETEYDQTHVGGKDQNRHKHKKRHVKGGWDKVAIVGGISRRGKVVAKVIEREDTSTIEAFVKETLGDTVTLIATDEHAGYRNLKSTGLPHESVQHRNAEYVRGNVHTNTMENFWALLKRCLHGTYISVEPFHLFRYLDEQIFRFNNRKEPPAGRFTESLHGIVGRRLTYKQLIGKDGQIPPSSLPQPA
jgi:hypothetical protein